MRVELPEGAGVLEGGLVVPEPAAGVVVFAHGSGSSRLSPRNREVALGLQRRGLGTLLVALLTGAEARGASVPVLVGRRAEAGGRVDGTTGALRFDVDLLAARLVAATDALRHTEA